jgi:lysophospholipase L1-like esterase
MKRILLSSLVAAALLLTLSQPASATPEQPANVPSDQNYTPRLNYQTYFNDYVALRKSRPADLVFIGDSITEQWRWGAGSPVWKKHFEERAFDFGLGSDKTQHALWRLENIDLSFISPKVAVIMCGTNNVDDTPEEIATGVKALIAATQKKFAGVKIVLVGILPNARANDKMAAANRLLAPMADKKTVFYLDLPARFTPAGDNWTGLSNDKLHLTAEGYETWASELEALLPTVLK